MVMTVDFKNEGNIEPLRAPMRMDNCCVGFLCFRTPGLGIDYKVIRMNLIWV